MGLFDLLWSFLPLLIGGVVVISILISRSNKPSPPSPDVVAWYLQQRNQEWLQFIEYYDHIAKTAAEKQLLRRMLYDAVSQGSGLSALAGEYESQSPENSAQMSQAAASQPALTDRAVREQPYAPQPVTLVHQAIDNASLLLYFGAFLFVASVGLFISFGGASGAVRTFAVFLVMAVLYGGGLWLFKTKPKQQRAGVAFASIGIVMAPLAGLASYEYIFTKQHGAFVWLLTSLFCLGLYAHALYSLRKPLISYLLLFTFLSLFESGVSVVSAPIYYYGWGLAFVGIILQLCSRWRGYYPELRDSSRQSSMLLLPVALVTSLVMLPSQGSVQFGVSLLLATLYYGLEAWSTKATEQQVNAVVSQVAAIGAAYSLAYPIWHSWTDVAIVVLAVNLAQVVAVIMSKTRNQLWQNFATITVGSAVVGIAPVVTNSNVLLASTAGLLLSCVVVYWRQRRADAYSVGVLALVALPLAYGQIALTEHWAGDVQSLASFVTLLVVLAVFMWQFKSANSIRNWLEHAEVSYTIAAAVTAVTTFFVDPGLSLAICFGAAMTFVLIAERAKQYEWTDAVGILLAVPIVQSWQQQPELLLSISAALAVLIVMSLRYRREFLRWASTASWLLLPLGLGRQAFGSGWNIESYVWAYLAVMFVLLLSRSIARGVLLFSGKTALSTYARSASLSYVFGYIAAAIAAVVLSLFTSGSQVVTSSILGILLATVLFVSLRIEKRQDTMALLPMISQGLLLSIIRPEYSGRYLVAYLLSSTGLALVTYLLTSGSVKQSTKTAKLDGTKRYLGSAALVTAFFAPATLFFVGYSTWPMALGLLVAGGLVSYDLRAAKQEEREIAGVIITAAILWFMGISHVEAFQAYVQVVVANLALYAYWRARRGERSIADQYLWVMLSVATIPLAIQSLSGVAGSLYGWWLLIEQVVFMLIGMAIHRRFITFWGLYVAVGAVLFQLRHLGWAALTLLAVFLIGIAMYQLQKHSDQN